MGAGLSRSPVFVWARERGLGAGDGQSWLEGVADLATGTGTNSIKHDEKIVQLNVSKAGTFVSIGQRRHNHAEAQIRHGIWGAMVPTWS